jgi:predicted DNA-binding transcriptional regulator AlpA
MQSADDRKVLTLTEGLRKLGICRASAYKLFADPNSDFLRPFRYGHGGKLYYREADIDAFLSRKVAEAQADAGRALELDPRGLSVRAGDDRMVGAGPR